MIGLLVLAAVLVFAAGLGIVLRLREGRIRVSTSPVASTRPQLPAQIRALIDPVAAVTLVQLSSTFCAPCRQARVLLADLAEKTQGLRHVELDVTNVPEVAAQLKVMRTPTTLALTPDGQELLRIGGVPRRETLAQALQPHLP